MNWLYDHLRSVPSYSPIVLCDRLDNRAEFPALEAHRIERDRLAWRLWHRVAGERLYPPFRRRLQEMDAQVLHSHFGYVAVGDVALHHALGCPWVIGFYGADVYLLGKSTEWRTRYAPVFNVMTKALALGPAMAETLAAIGCPAEKIEVHPLGVDTDHIPVARRTLARGEHLQIVFAGTFREKKGIEYLLHAAKLLRSSGVPFQLHLVGEALGRPGDAATRAEIFRLIGLYDLGGLIKHHGWLPFEELMYLALRSHVFVAPSVTASDGDAEGTPFVVQQMMATGMPVITTYHSDIPFVFGEHAHMLVPERDAGAIAERLQGYFDDPDHLTSDGLALSHQIRTHFDVRQCARSLAGLYDRVA